MRRRLIAIAFAALLGACATVTNPVTGEAERTVLDEQAELAEGRKAHPQILAEYGVVDDAQLQAYVNEIGQRLAKQSHRASLEWHFTVLDSPEINAFALPGGYVYITRGILAYLDSEADLAGVLGHEIGHVTARHGAQRATRQQTAGLGVLAATILGAVLGAGDLASQVSQSVAAGYVASYSRDQELQADQLGAEYLSRVNLNPSNMVDVIQVLANQERFAADEKREEGRATQERGAQWLASHPTNEQRLADIRQIASRYNKGSYTDDGRARYLRAIDGITFGESAQQGLTRGRNFYHEPLGFALTAPEGWKIQNQSDAVALVNKEGNAALLLRTVPPKAGNTHDEIIRNVVKPTEGRAERRTLNGLAATHFIGSRANQQGQQQRVELTVVTGPQDKNYLFVYSGRNAQALQQAYRQLQEAESTFRPLTAADRASVAPWKVQTVAYPRGGFAELAKQSPLPGNALQRLKLLNGVYVEGEPKPGQPVKTIR